MAPSAEEPMRSLPSSSSFLVLLLLQCGDVEVNPGPPRRAPKGPEKKEEKKEEANPENKVRKCTVQLDRGCTDLKQVLPSRGQIYNPTSNSNY